MRKKLTLSAIIVLLLAVASITVASAAADDDGGKIQLIAKTVQETEIDVPPEGEFSQGDHFVFTEDLFKDGKQVGWDGGTCTVVRLEDEVSASFNCVATFSLEQGQITAQGIFSVGSEAPLEPFTIAITGGTDAYEGAQGELAVEEVADGELQLTFDLG